MAANRLSEVEDVVEYCLYPLVPDNIDRKELHGHLEEQLDLYLAHSGPLLVNQIWQKDPFRLNIVTSRGREPAHLYGRTSYGDNIDDEWFIVYVLKNLTIAFPGLIARVWDNDGNFLLIEAANNLPRWVNPDTAENRVFIYDGKVHLVPLEKKSAEDGSISIQDAVDVIRNQPDVSIASSKVQRDIAKRLTDYPVKMKTNMHKAHCYLPANLAAILEYNPNLVAPIVEAFYTRDALDLQACVTMQNFRPGMRVKRLIKMTRCLYAQLMQQRFQPDIRSGFNLPAPSNPQFKSYDLGMKLAHGAEILCSKCGNSSDVKNFKGNLAHDTRWRRYLAALKEKGYFRGELEGSTLYDELLDNAKKYYFMTVLPEKSSTSEPGEEILRTLKLVSYDIEEMRRHERFLEPEDDDKWMTISIQQFDEIMQKAAGRDAYDLSSMSDSINSFVSHISSHEGAEFPKQDDGDIAFDPNSFMQTMQKMFDFDGDSGESSSELSEYGSEDIDLDLASNEAPTAMVNGQAVNGQAENASSEANADGVGDYLGIGDYMNMMDKELAPTAVGQSFERPKPPKRKHGKKKQTESQKKAPTAEEEEEYDDDIDDIDDIDDDFKPVDVDLNLVKNMLQSYKSQEGLAGPAGTILQTMGVQVPRDQLEDDY